MKTSEMKFHLQETLSTMQPEVVGTLIGELLDYPVFVTYSLANFVFSYNAVCKFLDDNGLVSMIRAHEAQDQGFKMYRMKDNFPRFGKPSKR